MSLRPVARRIPIPLRILSILPLAAAGVTPAFALPEYDFGNPSPDEQFQIELINRARADPAAEGQRLATTTDPELLAVYSQYGVNLAMMQSEFNAIPSLPPLAPHAALMASARNHSTWMLANATQSHYQTNPSNSPFERMEDAGYDYWWAGENIYAYSKSGEYGHAAFEVDWGTGGTGGMQNPRGHRDAIHSENYRELGVGVIVGSNSPVGPQVVTQDFGSRFNGPNHATGVVYYDLNGNDFYDVGEGIPGLTVNVAGASFSCTTADGGGWVVPVPTLAMTRTVTFSGPGLLESDDIDIPIDANAKLDLKLPYQPPAFTSADTADAGEPHTVSFDAVPGATSYSWESWTDSGVTGEDCDDTADVTVSVSGYNVLNTSVKHSGGAAFHLANPAGTSQWIELNPLFFGGGSPGLSFFSRIRYATTSEKFVVQIREVGTSGWIDVDTQTGFNGSGQSSFSQRSVSLPSMAGKIFQVRFMLRFSSGGYYAGSSNIYGWFFDEIVMNDCTGLEPGGFQTLGTTSLDIVPEAGTLLMAVNPIIAGNSFPAAYQTLQVAAAAVAPPGFAGWTEEWELAGGLGSGALADPHGDHDLDGRNHLIEYAFGMSPIDADDDTSRLPVPSTFANTFQFTYQRDTALADLTVEACVSTDGANWFAVGDPGAPADFTETTVATDGSIETRRAAVPLGGHPRLLMRVRVVRE